MRKAWRQGHEASNHVIVTVQEQSNECMLPSSLCTVQEPGQGTVPPTVRRSSHLNQHDNPSWNAQRPFSQLILSSWKSTLSHSVYSGLGSPTQRLPSVRQALY